MSMFGPKAGTVWLSSKSDPRWNCNWREKSLIVTSMDSGKVADKIKELTVKYGDPPSDLMMGCMKD